MTRYAAIMVFCYLFSRKTSCAVSESLSKNQKYILYYNLLLYLNAKYLHTIGPNHVHCCLLFRGNLRSCQKYN